MERSRRSLMRPPSGLESPPDASRGRCARAHGQDGPAIHGGLEPHSRRTAGEDRRGPCSNSPETSPAARFRGGRATSDEALIAKTGRSWAEWFEIIKAWGPKGGSHGDIADFLKHEQGVPGWWTQEITVGYEMARYPRSPASADGFTITASKAVGYDDIGLGTLTAIRPRTARFLFNTSDSPTRTPSPANKSLGASGRRR
jgi:hypothetical protein